MPISLVELVDSIKRDPALLLGAGASVPSGAPTGSSLAHSLWRKITKTEPISDDLLETTSILCRRYSRSEVVEQIKNTLRVLKPTGGLLGIPTVEWSAIFIDRYKVRLLVLRSSETAGISNSDRLALLRKAFELAMTNTHKHKLDKYTYREVCTVAIELIRRGENVAYLDEAIGRMREGATMIMDPDLDRMLQSFENQRARLS